MGLFLGIHVRDNGGELEGILGASLLVFKAHAINRSVTSPGSGAILEVSSTGAHMMAI